MEVLFESSELLFSWQSLLTDIGIHYKLGNCVETGQYLAVLESHSVIKHGLEHLKDTACLQSSQSRCGKTNFVSAHSVLIRGGQSGGAGGAQATPGILIFQKQVTLFTKSGDTLDLE